MMRTISRAGIIAGTTLLLMAGYTLPANAASATVADSGASSEKSTSVSESCVSQLTSQGIANAEAQGACTVEETVTTDSTFTVTPDQAREYAGDAQLDASQTQSLVASAAAGEIRGSSWSHEYNAVFVKEIHKGVTWHDGNRAWIASYRGQAGSHSCHTEGGYQVGATVTVISCNTPGPGASADAVERFDVNAVFKGSPIVLNVGLHMEYKADGTRNAWQVGG